MNFTELLQFWLKGELLQAKIMIAIGLVFLGIVVAILKSSHELLRGALIPLGLLTVLLVGYGGVILQTRPAHVRQSLELYENNQQEAITQEITKHTNDNKAGDMLTQYVYPALIILSALALLFPIGWHYKGMALGFVVLFASTFIMDYGFVSRSNGVIEALIK